MGGGGHHLEAFRRFLLFKVHTGEFPVASLDTSPPEEPQAFAVWLEQNGHSLVMEIYEAYRMGDVGKIYLLQFDHWLRGNISDASYKPANFVFFLVALLAFFVGLWLQGQRVFAAIVTFLVGSSYFQIFSAYREDNIFSWPISTLLLAVGLNAPFLFGRRHQNSWKAWLFCAVLTGILFATVRQIRPSPEVLTGSFALIFLLGAGAKPMRFFLPAALILSYLGTATVWAWHFDRSFSSAKNFVGARGGHVYSGSANRHHFFWHPFFCGLGDYGTEKGYRWDDFNAFAYALPKLRERTGNPDLWSDFSPGDSLDRYFMKEAYDEAGVYRRKLEDVPGYEDVLREKIISDVKSDPMWAMSVIGQRGLSLFTTTNDVQVWTPWRHYNFRSDLWGWLPVLFLWPLWKRKEWGVLAIMVAAFSLTAPAFLINSKLNMQHYSVAHIVAFAWFLGQLSLLVWGRVRSLSKR